MAKTTRTGTVKMFYHSSSIFWVSAPVLSYVYPRLTGHTHTYAWECFSIVNAGFASWIMMGAASSAGFSILAIAFMPFLAWLCIRGIGVKEWVFLILWYTSGIALFYGLGLL